MIFEFLLIYMCTFNSSACTMTPRKIAWMFLILRNVIPCQMWITLNDSRFMWSWVCVHLDTLQVSYIQGKWLLEGLFVWNSDKEGTSREGAPTLRRFHLINFQTVFFSWNDFFNCACIVAYIFVPFCSYSLIS